MDLSTTIADVRFSTCLMNAAGALCVTREELEALGRCRSGAIVTKSMTPAFRQGNPEPRYYSFPGGSINSMGLPNLGYPAYVTIIPTLRRFGKPVIASIAGLSPPEFLEAARAITAVSPDLIEVNLSCPNIQGKAANRVRRGSLTLVTPGTEGHRHRADGRQASSVFRPGAP